MATSILESPQAPPLRVSAADVLEHGLHETRRAMKSVVEDLEDLRDETIHQVKRHPVQAVSITFGAGLAVGLAAGWFVHQILRRRISSAPRTEAGSLVS